jgi:hypothetical protein
LEAISASIFRFKMFRVRKWLSYVGRERGGGVQSGSLETVSGKRHFSGFNNFLLFSLSPEM